MKRFYHIIEIIIGFILFNRKQDVIPKGDKCYTNVNIYRRGRLHWEKEMCKYWRPEGCVYLGIFNNKTETKQCGQNEKRN